MGRVHVPRPVAAADLAAPAGVRRRDLGAVAVATCKLTLGYLYPDIMSAYGDRGNIAVLMRRCGWRGIVTEVLELRLGDPVHPDDVDIFVIGNGGGCPPPRVAPGPAPVQGRGPPGAA